MTFGLSAAAVAGIASVAVSAGTAYYQGQQQKKALDAQKKATQDAQTKDAAQAVSAEQSAALAANQQLAATRRRRQSSALALGAGDSGLGTSSVLGAGSQPVSVSGPTTSALGKGA